MDYGDLIARDFGNLSTSKFNMSRVFLFPARLVFRLNKPRITVLGSEFAGEVETTVEDVKELGADRVIYYTKEDFTQSGETYNLIFDILGKSSFSQCKGSLKENGKYFLASFKTKQILQIIRTSIFSNKKVVCAMSDENRKDLLFIKDLINKEIIKVIIDRSFSLKETVEAYRYVENGLTRGNVVITLRNNNDT